IRTGGFSAELGLVVAPISRHDLEVAPPVRVDHGGGGSVESRLCGDGPATLGRRGGGQHLLVRGAPRQPGQWQEPREAASFRSLLVALRYHRTERSAKLPAASAFDPLRPPARHLTRSRERRCSNSIVSAQWQTR